MTGRAARSDNLADLLFDMESDVRDLTRWATTVHALSTSDSHSQDCLVVVGAAMHEVAERVEKNWERAFELSCSLRENGR